MRVKPVYQTMRSVVILLAAMMLWVLPPLSGGMAQSSPIEVIRLAMGDSQIVELDFDLADVIVGSEAVASVAVLSSRSLVVTPVSAGTTRVLLRDSAGVERRSLSIIVTESFAQLQAILDDLLPAASIKVRNVNGRAMIQGVVADEAEAERVRDIAQSYSQGEVIDALKIADPRQVMLKVNILELSRNGGKELGLDPLLSIRSGANKERVKKEGTENSDVTTTTLTSNVDLVLKALETNGLARRLANPTLISVNGATASFVVGGEVPITTTTEDGKSSTTYREYGVKLAFTPQVLPGQSIRLMITPEVSEVDWSRRVNDNPAFVTRRVDTTIELKTGESFAIAGLLQTDSVRSVRQFPWMGNIPILGALFRSSAYQNNQTELVVIVTPYLVNEESAEALQGDPTLQVGLPSDAETFLLGAMESDDEMIRRFKSGFGVSGPYGHILPAP
jgi:pilus assembly protein CpaC